MTPKMTTFEAIYGRISTRNVQRRAASEAGFLGS